MGNWRNPPTQIPENQIRIVMRTDVLVLGLGYAGTAALRAASECGANVIGVERQPESKYRTLGHNIGHINSQFLASRGVPKVDEIEYFNEWMRRSAGRANPALMMKYVQNCGTAFDWYMDGWKELEDMDIAFWPGGSQFDGEMSGYHFWQGTVNSLRPEEGPCMKLLNENSSKKTIPSAKPERDFREAARRTICKAQSMGAEILWDTEAIYLTKKDGRVNGAICQARSTGEYYRIIAEKGVVLSTGDFSGNEDMMQELVHDLRDLYREGDGSSIRGMGRDGSGICMGLWAGGILEAGSIPVMGGNYYIPRGLNRSFGILWLDESGRRFCNESFGDPQILGMMNNQMPRSVFYNIFDSSIEEDLQWAVPAHEGYDHGRSTDWNTILAAAVRAGKGGCYVRAGSETIRLVAGNSMDELLENSEFSATLSESVRNSINRYNNLCQNKRDIDFGKDAKLLRPLDHWPLFIQCQSYRTRVLCTVGGLVTDEDQHCLDQSFHVIPGLYASGNTCGRRFGTQYSPPMAGASISVAITLGREVGKTIATLE